MYILRMHKITWMFAFRERMDNYSAYSPHPVSPVIFHADSASR